jgi:hypothetical protein
MAAAPASADRIAANTAGFLSTAARKQAKPGGVSAQNGVLTSRHRWVSNQQFMGHAGHRFFSTWGVQ